MDWIEFVYSLPLWIRVIIAIIFCVTFSIFMFHPEISGKTGMTKPKGSGDINTQSTNGHALSAQDSNFYGPVHVGDIINSALTDPEIEMRIGGTDLKIENNGAVNVINFELIAVIGVNFDMASGRLGQHQVKSLYKPIVIFPKIGVKQGEIGYPIKDMVTPIGDNWGSYGFVLRFRRENDKKSYLRTMEVFTKTNEKGTFFFPLHQMKGVVHASNVSEKMAFEKTLLEYFKRVYSEDFQIQK